MTLDDQDVDAIARRVVELLDERRATPGRLVDACELAGILGVEPVWVREHADELGALRLGDGPKPRLWFDVDEARERMRRRDVAGRPVAVRRAPAASVVPQVRPRRARRRA